MASLGKLKQIRNGHRLHTTNTMNKMIKGQPTTTQQYDESKILLATLTKKIVLLEKCDSDIMEHLTSDEDITAEIEDATTFSDKVIETKTKLEMKIKYFEQKSKSIVKTDDDDEESPPSAHATSRPVQIKLPSIEIGEYNGSLLTWNVFWDKFEVAVHSRSDLADIQKYTYLKSYLTGEAKRSIQGISYDKDNYQNAIDALTARFGNKQLRISAHMKELQNVKGVQSINDVAGMRRMYDSLETNITNLKELKVDVTTYGSLLIAVIFDRIPEELRVKISLEFGDGEWKLDEAMDVFKLELEARERSVSISGSSRDYDDNDETSTFYVDTRGGGRGRSRGRGRGGGRRFDSPQQRRQQPQQQQQQQQQQQRFGNGGNGNNGNNRNGPSCVFCKENHLSSRCRNVTSIDARFSIVREERRCFICLKDSHRSRDCNLNFYSCVKCGQKHNYYIITMGDPKGSINMCLKYHDWSQ